MGNRPVTVQAEWDDEAEVWCIFSDDVPGLNIEAERYEDIETRAGLAIGDLADCDPQIASLAEGPFEIVARRHVAHLAVA